MIFSVGHSVVARSRERERPILESQVWHSQGKNLQSILGSASKGSPQ
jgi:hypothetical protein